MAASSEPARKAGTAMLRLVVLIAALVMLCWRLPLFHVVPLAHATPLAAPDGAKVFDPQEAAQKVWAGELATAAARAADLKQVVMAMREDPVAAKTTFAKAAGVGAAYFFVRGAGRVVARERNYLRIEVDGMPGEIVALRIGPIFGNTVRDGCGLLDVNAFPGLQEFNALAAQLNALVEKNVLPTLREKAVAGTAVQFTGCAEAPDAAADAGEPLLTLVPIRAEVR